MSPPRPACPARPLLALLLLATAAASPAAERPPVRIEIEGVEGEFAGVARDNLELTQYLNRELSAAQLQRLVRKGEDEIRRGLEPWGYYDVQVRSELTGTEGDYQATFHVTLGERVIVRSSSVVMNGPAHDFEPVRLAVDGFEPRVDEALDHWLYELRKTEISSLLQGFGYLDAQLERHRIEVTRATRSASIDLAWNSGERYRMGAVSFAGNQLPESLLRRYVPWEPGAPYSVDDLLRLQQRLVEADYFTSVAVTPDTEKRADGTVPVDVQLVRAKRNIYTASAFVSTDTGPGGRVGVQRRWLNDSGHKAGVQLEYASRLEAYSAYYRIPRPGKENRLYNFAGGYRDEETGSTRSRLRRFSANEQLDDWHGYARTLGVQYVDGNYVVAEELLSSKVVYGEVQLIRRRADDLMFPSRGVSMTYTARGAAEGLLSDTYLASLRADLKWVRPAGDGSRWILRASAGALETGNFDALPPDLRFFAGGDRSIRGFDYQQIGEIKSPLSDAAVARLKSIDSKAVIPDYGVIGGRYLTLASTEFEHYFSEQWGGAVFVDAGDAFNSKPNANVGAGVGVRWRSPVGIVRVDFAVPVRTDLDDHGLRFHIMIGPDL
jgi:translocation and assembly module TamA